VEWWNQAACAQTDPDAFYPEPGDNATEAKRVCAHCDVRNQCLEHALAHDERFGIWGGLCEPERRHFTASAWERTG
jgi:WhiB family redox-sensing transcriptional regulator